MKASDRADTGDARLKGRGGRRKLVGRVVVAVAATAAVAFVAVALLTGGSPEPNREPSTGGTSGAGTNRTDSASRHPSIAGSWESNYGPVKLEHRAVGTGLEPVEVTGSWKPQGEEPGEITGGTFDPRSGIVRLRYTYDNGITGVASLELSIDGSKLSGLWIQSNGSGEWVLRRRAPENSPAA